jgi:hypothetical protein
MRDGKRLSLLPVLIAGSICLAAPTGGPAQANPDSILTGKWAWQATCDHGEFHGIMQLDQQGSTFTGAFLQTNFWDKGIISNGVLRGSNMTFDRTYGLIEQHLSADLSDGNRKLSGPYDSAMFGKCVLRGQKQ